MGYKIHTPKILPAVCIFLSSASLLSCFLANGSVGGNVVPTPTPAPALGEIVKTDNGYFKRNGWDTSIVGSMTVVQEFTSEHATLDGPLVTIECRRYKPEPGSITTEPSVFLSDKVSSIRIDNVVSMSFKGKTFAYSIVSALLKRDEGSGKHIQNGPGIVYLYVDEDGDGRFERLKADSSKFYVPQWVYK